MTSGFSWNQLPVRADFELVVGQDLEGQVEPAVELVLPLLDEAPGADDQAAMQVAANHQLLDEQPRHDRLAGARVVGEQEAQRLAREHLLVDGRDLVGQRIDQRGVDSQERIEQVGEADPVGLGDEPEERAVAIEAPGLAGRGDFQRRLSIPVEELVPEPARCVLVRDLEDAPVPLDVTIVTRASGRMPFTDAPGLRSSRRLMF